MGLLYIEALHGWINDSKRTDAVRTCSKSFVKLAFIIQLYDRAGRGRAGRFSQCCSLILSSEYRVPPGKTAFSSENFFRLKLRKSQYYGQFLILDWEVDSSKHSPEVYGFEITLNPRIFVDWFSRWKERWYLQFIIYSLYLNPFQITVKTFDWFGYFFGQLHITQRSWNHHSKFI